MNGIQKVLSNQYIAFSIQLNVFEQLYILIFIFLNNAILFAFIHSFIKKKITTPSKSSYNIVSDESYPLRENYERQEQFLKNKGVLSVVEMEGKRIAASLKAKA